MPRPVREYERHTQAVVQMAVGHEDVPHAGEFERASADVERQTGRLNPEPSPVSAPRPPFDAEVAEAVEVFSPVKTIRQPLELLDELGLGYLHLGQPSNTLSGGEAQRIKLVSELAAGLNTGPTLYVMDEPTTGLHRDDVDRLLGVLDRLVERGDTVAVIEHHPDVMLASDWVIDLGPEGGIHGGRVVAQGTPETIAKRKRSHTAQVLTTELKRGQTPFQKG